MSTLRNKAISGIFWSFLQKVGSRGVIFIVMIFLARLLNPKDFGLIGMLMIFIEVSQAIVDGGFNLALIQKKDTNDEDYSSVFYINLIVSGILYAILFFTAPIIANFYHQPLLIPLTRVLGLVFVINAFSFVQETRLKKDIHFKTLMLIHIPSTIIGGIISVMMAIYGLGVWSIVGLQLTTRFAYTVQIWIRAKWKPLFSFHIKNIWSLFSFGGKIMLTSIITSVYNNIFMVIIGRLYPASSVGYYQNAYNVAFTPANTITSVMNDVAFPAFSSIQDDNRRLKIGYKNLMQQAVFWICPLYTLAGVLAKPLFEFVFTPKWLSAVPYFQCLCIVGIFHPLKTYNLNIVNVKGRSDLFLKLQVVWRVFITIGIIVTASYGIKALVIVQALSYVFAFLLFGYYAGRFIQYSISEQLKDILSILLLSVSVGLVVLFVDNSLSEYSNIVRLLIGFSLGLGVYWIAANYFKLSPYLYFREILMSRISNRTF